LLVSDGGTWGRSTGARVQIILAFAFVLAAFVFPAVASADSSAGAASDTPTTTQGQLASGATASRGSTPGQSEGSGNGAQESTPKETTETSEDAASSQSDVETQTPASTTTSATTTETPASEKQTPAGKTNPVADQASGATAITQTSEPTPTRVTSEATSSETTPSGEAAGAAEPEPSSTTEQTTTIDQGASATAVAEQTGGTAGQANGVGNGQANGFGNGEANGQGNGAGNGTGNGTGNAFGHGNGAGNAHSDVRVEQPGTGEGTSQGNKATAQAKATATAAVDMDGTTTAAQAADASAKAVQSEIGNVQVSVRIDSPGNDGAVTQANEANAASSASTGLQAGETTDASGQATADATAVQDGVANTVVSVRVFSPGDDGVVRQVNDAGATATADDEATATAVQDGVRNTYVGIRVESPGERGAVEQSSVADADTTAGGLVTVVSEGINTVVIADIKAPDLSVPDRTTVWEWTWQWSGDEADLTGKPFVVSGNTWEWSWGDVPEGTVVEREATTADVAGTWTWDWSWERELPGWAWEWRQQATLACATCVWIWRWDWQWKGQPPATPSSPPTDAPPTGAPEQSSSVTAVAEAHVDAAVNQVVVQDSEGANQFAGQIADAEQVADASALARQRLDGAGIVSIVFEGDRSLVVTARATTATWIDQSLGQGGGVAGDGMLDQWSGQQAVVLQAAFAEALGEQSASAAADGHGAVLADAVAVSGNEQWGVQTGLLGDGLLDQWLGQQLIVAQVAGAAARTTQTLDKIAGAVATAKSVSANLSLVAQAAAQDAARGAGIGSQTVAQYAQVVQDALVLATTSQPVNTSTRLATSNAGAINRSMTVQGAAQWMNGSSFLDLQDIAQQVAVTQEAFAVSSSTGGIGGSARTVNCATTQQSAGQGIGSFVSVDTDDLTSFCVPPSQATGELGPDGSSGTSSSGSPGSLGSSGSVNVAVMTLEDEILIGHGTARFRAAPSSVVTATSAAAAAATRSISESAGESASESAREAAIAAAGRAAALSQVSSQISSPVPSQAGFDSRPKGSPGADTVAGESPLPWTGGPPPGWATAFADAAAAFGGSGIAAILAFLVLTPPLLRRARDGAVVGRPVSVSVPIDVPV